MLPAQSQEKQQPPSPLCTPCTRPSEAVVLRGRAVTSQVWLWHMWLARGVLYHQRLQGTPAKLYVPEVTGVVGDPGKWP